MTLRRGFRKACLMVLLAAVISACVRPVEPTPTPQPTPFPPTPTNAPPVVATTFTFPVANVIQWLGQQGIAASNLTIFYQLDIGADQLVGYVFQSPIGQRCVGIVQATPSNLQIWSGNFNCQPGTTPVILGTLPFALTTTGAFYVAAFGFVDPGAYPNAGGAGLVFPNGMDTGVTIINSGFILAQPGIAFPSMAVITDQGGNELIRLPFQ